MTENRIRDGKLFAEGVAVIHVGREWVTLRGKDIRKRGWVCRRWVRLIKLGLAG
jgi:hypothetical protein